MKYQAIYGRIVDRKNPEMPDRQYEPDYSRCAATVVPRSRYPRIEMQCCNGAKYDPEYIDGQYRPTTCYVHSEVETAKRKRRRQERSGVVNIKQVQYRCDGYVEQGMLCVPEPITLGDFVRLEIGSGRYCPAIATEDARILFGDYPGLQYVAHGSIFYELECEGN